MVVLESSRRCFSTPPAGGHTVAAKRVKDAEGDTVAYGCVVGGCPYADLIYDAHAKIDIVKTDMRRRNEIPSKEKDA